MTLTSPLLLLLATSYQGREGAVARTMSFFYIIVAGFKPTLIACPDWAHSWHYRASFSHSTVLDVPVSLTSVFCCRGPSLSTLQKRLFNPPTIKHRFSALFFPFNVILASQIRWPCAYKTIPSHSVTANFSPKHSCHCQLFAKIKLMFPPTLFFFCNCYNYQTLSRETGDQNLIVTSPWGI